MNEMKQEKKQSEDTLATKPTKTDDSGKCVPQGYILGPWTKL